MRFSTRIAATIGAAALIGTIAGPPAASAQEAAGPITIELDSTGTGPVISRHLFGQFAEMLGEGIYGGVWVGPDSNISNVRGIRSDVVQALRALKVPNVRWPGGCYGDLYHWREGVGPQRRTRVNVTWGNSMEPNTFGTHEFMDFAEQIGAEPYISLNVGSGTVQEAADWLEYMTTDRPTSLGQERAANGRKQPWRLPFVGIGNEAWGCGGGFTAESYTEKMKPFALFTRNLNPAQRSAVPFQTAPDAMQRIVTGEGLDQTSYTETLMKAWKDRPAYSWSFEGLSLHHYIAPTNQPLMDSSTDFGEKEYAGLLDRSYSMDRMIVQHAAIMDKYDPDKKVAMVIDEWGAWLRPLPDTNFLFLRQQNSLRDALSAAIQLNIFARHADRVRMANIAQMVNVIQAMILTDGPRMVLTPTYHAFAMYVPFQDATAVPLKVSAGQYVSGTVRLPQIDAIAARGKDGGTWLALVNLDPARDAVVNVRGTAAKSARGQVLTAEKVNAVNTFDAPETIRPRPYTATARGGALALRLAPKSLTVVRLTD